MKLLVIVLCLLSERFLIHSLSYHRFSWFGDYSLFIKNIINKNNQFLNPWLILLAIILPIILITSLIYFLFHSVFFGFLSLIISIVIFSYCLGPQNAFYPVSVTSTGTSNSTTVGNYFSQVNRELFSIVFWYVVAGPIFVLAYRLITLCRDVTPINEQASQATNFIEWIPARVTALLYLLVGNFQQGFVIFVRVFFSKPEMNNQMLTDCGLQAVRTNESDEIPLFVAEGLVEHAIIVLLVFIALFTLAAWL